MKSTTLYVGRIAPSVEDSVLRELLEACGEVQVWKPTLDPDTSKFKGFGFCTYAEPEGVSIAIRVLNNLNVDGQQLIAKTNKATQEYLDWVEREKQHQRATPGAAAAAGGEGTPDPTALENAALEKVMGILSQRAPQQLAEQPEPGEAVAAASDFLAGLQSTSTPTAQQEPPGPSARPQPTKEEERELLRRQREEQRRREDEDQAYRESERAWEAIERTQQREREREADKERDLLKERARAIHADNSGVGSDDEEIWRRKWYSQSRRAVERRARRRAEEEEEAAAVRKEQEAIAAAAAAAAAEGTDREAEAERASADAAQSALDEQDAIYRAMMAAAGESLQPGMGAPGGERRALGTLRRKAQAAFVEEEEEAAPKRKLIPITYTEEELEAMRRAAEAAAQEEQAASGAPEQASKPEAAATLPSPAPAAAAPQPADPEQLKRQVMARVPKGQDAVFAWQVRWELLDAAPADVKQRIQAWVGKRIQMLMGEEEESFASFVMQQVARHQPALKVLEALQDVLDEDAPEFVTKLYQVIIYESLKLEHSL